MADVKISALPAASTPLTGGEVLPIVQSGTTTKVAVSNLTAGLAGTASININGTVGATTPTTGAFTSGTFSTTLGVTGTSTLAAVNASGKITSTVGNNGIVLENLSATTGYQYLRLVSTGASGLIGIDSSVGGVLGTGTTAYSMVLSTQNATSLHLVSNSVVGLTLASGGAVTIPGTLGVTGGITQSGSVVSSFTNTGTNYTIQAINSNASSPNGINMQYTGADPNTNGLSFLACATTSGGSKFFAFSNGGLANFSANNQNLSDLREKKNIALAGSYIDKICAIPVKTFLYNDQTDLDLNLGVIAQDVEAIAPELITQSDWGIEGAPKIRKSIYQTDLQYALMKCIQEQQVMITSLTARLAALEAK